MDANLRTLRAQDYHVAWTSALLKEYIIACAMLDERHNDPLDRPEDHRFYTFGRMNGHNVVIARLPEGTVGIDNAASLAADMASSFTAVRFGLMVGIAGGAPTIENDIRLGDIVVSIPNDKKRLGGVVQYDFGSSVQDQGYLLRGSLDRPPTILLNAVGELQARYSTFGHTIEMMVAQTANDFQRGKLSAYKKPDPALDVLFKPNFVHKDESLSCTAMGCYVQTNNMVDSTIRSISRDQLVIHLGVIGSGNTLMRDAGRRDHIVMETGVKCFDMESAGLMNNRLRWLVIRGICDYCDSHKNDDWQNYAAAVAAVYAKELLSIVRPLKTTLGDSGGNITETTMSQPDLFQFLAHDNMNARRDAAVPENTFNLEWVWSTSLSTWLESGDSEGPFFICGKPGSGKSTLMAYLSDNRRTRNKLKSRDASFEILHFFYDYRAGPGLANSIEGMLRILLYQSAKKIERIQRHLNYELQLGRLKLEPLSVLLDTVCTALISSNARICAFVDGLDEYKGSYVELLQILRSLIDRSDIKLCVASRPEVPVANLLEIYSQIFMQDYNKSSMEVYAREKLLIANDNNINLERKITTELQQALVLKAEGIILWFKLAFDEAVRLCEEGYNNEQITQFVEQAPLGLEAIYWRILSVIPPEHKCEGALILYLVQQFLDVQQSTGIPENYPWLAITSLDYIFEVYQFLSCSDESAFGLQDLRNHDDLRGRFIVVLRGLLEVHTLEDTSWERGCTNLDVRYIHKTFYSFIRENDWVERNLHTRIKQKYPDTFPLRLTADVVAYASTSDVLTGAQREALFQECRLFFTPFLCKEMQKLFKMGVESSKLVRYLIRRKSLMLAVAIKFFPGLLSIQERLVNEGFLVKAVSSLIPKILVTASQGYTLPEVWQQRREVLFTSCSILICLAKQYEQTQQSSYLIVHQALQAKLDILIGLANFTDYGTTIIKAILMDDRAETIFDLYLAVAGGLSGYFGDRMAGSALSHEQRESLITAILGMLHSSETHDLTTIPTFLSHITAAEHSIGSQHLCLLFGRCAALTVGTVRFLKSFLSSTERKAETCFHHKDCGLYDTAYNTLIHWAVLEPCGQFDTKCEGRHDYMSELRDLLLVLLLSGMELNKPCYPRGTILQAILDPSLPPRNTNFLQLLGCKFSVLVAVGIDPEINSPNGTGLQAAQKLKKSLRKGFARWKIGYSDTGLEEVDFVIQALEFYKENQSWPENLHSTWQAREDGGLS